MTDKKNLAGMIAAMTIFGTIGIFRYFIPFSSGFVALARAALGAAVLLLVMLWQKKRPDFVAIKKNWLSLTFSGVLLGFNWVLLFEAYKYTTVAIATLSYYMAPIILLLVAPIFLGERLTAKKGACIAAAFVGMVLVSGVLDGGEFSAQSLIGVLLGLAAAVFYATIVIVNKKTGEVAAFDKTVMQFGVSVVVLLVYVLLSGGMPTVAPTLPQLLLLLTVGIVHTGIAYLLYFGTVPKLPAQTVALLGYIDPALAVLLSAWLLQQPLTLLGGVGAVLILGAAIVGET